MKNKKGSIACSLINITIPTNIPGGGSTSPIAHAEETYKGILIPLSDKEWIVFALGEKRPPAYLFRRFIAQKITDKTAIKEIGDINVAYFIVQAIKYFVGIMETLQKLVDSKITT